MLGERLGSTRDRAAEGRTQGLAGTGGREESPGQACAYTAPDSGDGHRGQLGKVTRNDSHLLSILRKSPQDMVEAEAEMLAMELVRTSQG